MENTNKDKRGGYRPGSGRKPIEGARRRTLMATDEEYEMVKNLIKQLRKDREIYPG